MTISYFVRIFKYATRRRSREVALFALLAFEAATAFLWCIYADQAFVMGAPSHPLLPLAFRAALLLAIAVFLLLAGVRALLREDFGKGFKWWKYTMWMAYCCPGVIVPPELEQLAREAENPKD